MTTPVPGTEPGLVLRVSDRPWTDAVVALVITTFAARAALPADRVAPLADALAGLVASGSARGAGGRVDLEAQALPAGLRLRVRGLSAAAAERLADSPPAPLQAANGGAAVVAGPHGAAVELVAAW